MCPTQRMHKGKSEYVLWVIMMCLFRFIGLIELIYIFYLSISIKLSGFLFLFVAWCHCASLEFDANLLPGITDTVTQM